MPRLLSPLVLLVLLVAHAAHAEVKPLKGWRQMQSANFYLIGDLGEGDLRRVAGRLEQFRAAVGMILPKATITSATPTTVLVFRSNRNFEPFKPLYNGKIREDTAGYFVSGPAVNYIALTTESDSTDEDARFGLLKRIFDFEQQLKAGEAVVERTAEGPRMFKLDLRAVKGGESQLKGMLRVIECRQGQIQMVVEHDGKTSHVRAASFDGIEFMTYRESQGGRIECGKRPDGDRVLVTYRTGLQGDSVGELVAVEFLPLTQEPK